MVESGMGMLLILLKIMVLLVILNSTTKDSYGLAVDKCHSPPAYNEDGSNHCNVDGSVTS